MVSAMSSVAAGARRVAAYSASISTTKLVLSTLKTVVFGYLVAVTGCYFGMNASGGTEGVGNAATRGVVASIFLVLIANVFLVKLIEMIS